MSDVADPLGNTDTKHHVAGPGEIDAVAATLASAFSGDPVWSRILVNSPRFAPAWWRLFVEGALPHGWVWATEDCEAVAVWLPPGCDELGPAQELEMRQMVEAWPSDRREALDALVSLFHAARPVEEHFYLSLLGTHHDHRGVGLGMALLVESLSRIDLEHQAAYLESSNPANLPRYRSVGFVDLDNFVVPDGGPTVTTMWRSPR